MAVMPQFFVGRKLNAFTVTPQTVAGDGTLADGTSASLAGLWDTLEISMAPETEEISAADASNTHNVLLKNNYTCRITTLLRSAAGTGLVNPLASILSNTANEVFKIVVTRKSDLTAGAGTAVWTFYGLKTGYDETLNKGRSTGVASFAMIDPGTTNPTYPTPGTQP